MQSMFRKLVLAAAISGLSLGVCAQTTNAAPESPSASTTPGVSKDSDAAYQAAVSKCELQTGVDRNVCLGKAAAARNNATSSGQSGTTAGAAGATTGSVGNK